MEIDANHWPALSRHMVIFGEQGSGKTLLALALVCRYLRMFYKRRFVYVSCRPGEIERARDVARRIEGSVDAFNSLVAAQRAARAGTSGGGDARVDVPVVVDNYNVLLSQEQTDDASVPPSKVAREALADLLSAPLVIVTSIWRPPPDLLTPSQTRRRDAEASVRAPSSGLCNYCIFRIDAACAPADSKDAEQKQVYLDDKWKELVRVCAAAPHLAHYDYKTLHGAECHEIRASVIYG